MPSPAQRDAVSLGTAVTQRRMGGKVICKIQKDTYHAFTLHSNLGTLYVLIALSLYPFPTCTYTVSFPWLVIISIEQSSVELGDLAVTHLLEHYCLVLYTRQIGYE